jgi:Ala-tRNA(Pro) deacylase
MNCHEQTLKTKSPDPFGRLQQEIDSFQLLDRLGIDYAWLDHEIKMTIADCEDIDEILEIKLCKNLFLWNKAHDSYYLLMMPGHKKFITKEVSAQVGSSRLEFAPGEEMEALLNLSPGSVSVLGLMYDTDNRVQLLIDRDVLAHPYIGCHPCINTSSLRMPTTDFLEKLLPAIGHKPIILDL